jgi:predicted dehydrogenase
VLVEKPLGVNVEQCLALREQLAGTHLVLQVAHNRRFDPGIAFAQRFIKQEMGQVQALKAWYYDSVYRYTMTDNLQPVIVTSTQARRPEGNPKQEKQRYYLLTHGSHMVDMTRFLAGEIASVQVRFAKKFESYCWYIAADFVDGSVGHLDLIIPIRGDYEEGFHVFGEYGNVEGHFPLPWFHKSSVVEAFSTRDRQYHRPLGEDAYTYKLQIEGFADTILKGTPMLGAGIDDGIAVVRILVAIARSTETGERICVADAIGSV